MNSKFHNINPFVYLELKYWNEFYNSVYLSVKSSTRIFLSSFYSRNLFYLYTEGLHNLLHTWKNKQKMNPRFRVSFFLDSCEPR